MVFRSRIDASLSALMDVATVAVAAEIAVVVPVVVVLTVTLASEPAVVEKEEP